MICANIFCRALAFAFPAAILILFLSGCEKASVPTSRLGAVTDEIVAAAQKVTGPKTDVTIHRGASGKLPADSIYISLSDPSEGLALRHALAEIAQHHKLSVVEVSSAALTASISRLAELAHTLCASSVRWPPVRIPLLLMPLQMAC